MPKDMNGFHDIKLLIERVSQPEIMHLLQSEIDGLEGINRLTEKQIERLWIYRDFVEIWNIFYALGATDD